MRRLGVAFAVSLLVTGILASGTGVAAQAPPAIVLQLSHEPRRKSTCAVDNAVVGTGLHGKGFPTYPLGPPA